MNKRGKVFYEDLDLRYSSKIALFMHNRPEFVTNWYGTINIGAVPAFINNNLRLVLYIIDHISLFFRLKQLTHCLNISDSSVILVDGADDNLEAIFDIREEILKSGKRILVDDADCQLPSSDFERFTPLLENKSVEAIPRSWGRDQIQQNDPFCLIFTSGTTGLPKAAPYTHQAAQKSCSFKYVMGMKPGDVNYCALPLSHTMASQVGVTGAVIAGASIAIAPRFSATKFWEDVVRYDATYVHYIGQGIKS